MQGNRTGNDHYSNRRMPYATLQPDSLSNFELTAMKSGIDPNNRVGIKDFAMRNIHQVRTGVASKIEDEKEKIHRVHAHLKSTFGVSEHLINLLSLE